VGVCQYLYFVDKKNYVSFGSLPQGDKEKLKAFSEVVLYIDKDRHLKVIKGNEKEILNVWGAVNG
jgi:hypothetical protein